MIILPMRYLTRRPRHPQKPDPIYSRMLRVSVILGSVFGAVWFVLFLCNPDSLLLAGSGVIFGIIFGMWVAGISAMT